MNELEAVEEEFLETRRQLNQQEDELTEMRYKARHYAEEWIAWVHQFHNEQATFAERQASVRELVQALEEFEHMLNQKEFELEEYREELTREYHRKLDILEENNRMRHHT